jgi:dTDP-4-amino-4,6-dideoxygalactose transaminase
MQEKIWLSPPHMGGSEQKYINQAFEENYIAPAGSNINAFEKELGEYIGIPYVAALTTGTAAIHLALILAGVSTGDEVLVPTFTFAATLNPIVYLGGLPVLIDSDPESWNINPDLLRQAIEDRLRKGKKPKAIILVHLYGMPAKMNEIIEISDEYGIPIIEDAAEALGSEYRGQKCGTFGLYSILSFNGNKIITTSGGGALISRKKEAISRAKFLATQAKDDAIHYQHSEIGYNYRMSNIVAGIGRGQLEVIKDRINKRRANNNSYYSKLGKIRRISFLRERPGVFSNFWLTTILIDAKTNGGVSREHVRLALENENIESRPLWKPMHLQPVFANCPAYVDGTSDNLFKSGLCLPSGSNLSEDDLFRICDIIKNVLN